MWLENLVSYAETPGSKRRKHFECNRTVLYLSLALEGAPRYPAHKVLQYIQTVKTTATIVVMPGPTNTLLIEGSFEELSDELAHYIDDHQKKQNPDSASIQPEITSLLERKQKDEVLKKLVTGSAVLNIAPEKGEPNATTNDLFTQDHY